MKFTLDIESDMDDMMSEVAHALTNVADRLRDGVTEGVIYNINGNRVGQWELK